MMFMQIGALALVLFLVLRAIQVLYLKVVVSTRSRRLFLRWFPVIELLMWIAFGYWALMGLFGESDYYSLLTGALALVIVLLLGWYLMRDFIAGFILRSENSLAPGELLIVGDSEGIISKTGYRSLQLTINTGEKVRIPYSVLITKQLVQPAEKSILNKRVIFLEVETSHASAYVRELLTKRLLEMPWVLTSTAPSIAIAMLRPGMFKIEIHVKVLNEEALLKTHAELVSVLVF
jgi:small-conductance mechanosensitive channel